MFTYEWFDNESKTVVYFKGDMDIDVTEIMEEQLSPALFQCSDVEIDFADVSFVDSSGIGLLMTLIANLREKKIPVVVINLQPEVKEVFTLLQLPDILGHDVFPDFEKH